MGPHLAFCTASLLVLSVTALAGTKIEESPPAPESAGPPDTLFKMIFGRNDVWDKTYDDWVQWKKDHNFPVTIGAQNWWNVDRGPHLYGNGYGVPGLRGTYYWFVNFDPSYKFKDEGFVQQIGLHLDGRIRDTDEKFRSFFGETYWFYELYAYADTKWGTFKVGEIAMDFGIPWDYCWWEGTPYFDGFKFNPAYGVSWHKDFKASSNFTIPITAQYFLREDNVSGAEPGADAESTPGLTEKNTFVARIVPTLQINKDTSLAVGASGLFGSVAKSYLYQGVDNQHGAWDAEATLKWKDATVFGEFLRSYGAASPARYVSGGPSDLMTTYRVGATYTFGPFTPHIEYSEEEDRHPTGRQHVFDVGVNTRLAKNITLYTEYVKWNVVNSAGVKSRFADGFELVVAWSF
jgi:hypothetical protein